ncbi:MAG: glycoside hydrolase family 127 protein [Tannerella sp.]|jgi:DUF1680 family protein|nr:glycoside hydrolase family 127 protein [Tannerella sp.]
MIKNLNLIMSALVCSFLLMPMHSESSNFSAAEKFTPTETRSITKVESIHVECPTGTAPRLPFQVWVTYSDGRSEYRQTRWSNSARSVEEEQANPESYPAGHEYTVNGFIIGDNTTANGFPIIAHVKVVSEAYTIPSNTPVAETVPLNKVTITGDNRLTSNRELAIREIISWDVSQQLYNYRDTYGQSTQGYTVSDGWDSPTTKLKGHGSGHYMSALAQAFASATNPEHKNILRNNMTRMVNELRECQEKTFVWNNELGRYWEARDFAPEAELREMKGTWKDFDIHKTEWAKYGYGYLNAIPAHHAALIEMYRAYNNENWVWAPYYSIHKQLAGLIDIANYIDDPEVAAKALLIAKDMGLWIWNRLHYRTYVDTDGTQEERRAKPGNRYEMWNMYIAGEDGGTGESLARLSEMVSDPEEKAHLLEASNFFDSPAFYDPLARNIDDVRTRHANQHIPKIISALRSFKGNNDPYYYNLSQNFWEMIQGRYRYSSGGVGNGEMFRQPYAQILSMTTNGAPTLNETCCAYNLAKLTKDLNCFNPDDASYMDYYERVLYNQLVGSLHHTHYMTTYQYAVGLNASKPWGNRTPQSTCCGGTGSENHVKYQEATYFVSENTLWVALYMPTTLQWDAKGVTLQQDCLWPAESSTIRMSEGKANFSMKLRVPYWATEGFDIKLNGASIASSYQPSSYVTIPARNWTSSDVVEITMPFSKHIDFGPDKMETADGGRNQPNIQFAPMWAGTLMYGPLAMTASDVDNWDLATLTVDSYLESIIINGTSGGSTGSNGNLYTLTQGGKTFEPDYFRDENSTHYFRINLVDDMTSEFRELLSAKLKDATVFQSKNYSKASYKALKTAITDGNKLQGSGSATQSQITGQISAIDHAINNLESPKLDKSELVATLKEAESKVQADYTSDKYTALQMTITAAKEVNETGKSQLSVDKQILALHKAMDDLVLASSVDKSYLGEVMALAIERKDAQEAWNNLTVKVPEYSPWAPHAFRRLMYQLDKAQAVYQNEDKNYNQSEVNSTASALNAAINTMRPGNLPEPEDLYPLSTLLRQASRVIPADVTPAITEAIEYAEMVVAYVNDGSGTHDMIQNATEKLREALK